MSKQGNGSYVSLYGADVVCGGCGKRQRFMKPPAPGDVLARMAGWQIEWRPWAYVRCPNCKTLPTS